MPRLFWAVVCAAAVAHGAGLRSSACSYSVAAQAGDDCLSMAEAWGITEAVFARFNPDVRCGAPLEAGHSYCVQWAAEASAPPSTTASTATKGHDEMHGGSVHEPANAPAATSQRPVLPPLTQPSITPNCKHKRKHSTSLPARFSSTSQA